MARLVSAFVLLLCMLLPFHAKAYDDDRTGQLSALRVDGAPVLLRYEVEAACGDLETAYCAVAARWTLPASAEPRTAVLYLVAAEGTKVRVDGVPVRFTVEVNRSGWIHDDLSRVRVVLPPSATPQVLALSTALGVHGQHRGCGMGTLYTLGDLRHITQGRDFVHLELDADLGDDTEDPPRATFDGEIDYSVAAPRGWTVYGGTGRRTEHGKRWHFSNPYPELTATNQAVIHGPVVGVGARFPKRRDAHLWLRGGWEVTSFPSMAYSLAIESDLERTLVVPMTEIGTPSLFLLPSLSVGVGAPIRVAPEFRPGVRVTGGVNAPLISVVGGYDHFPAFRGQSVERLGFVGLQFSI